ncbi:MAG: PDZ domain-containing protein [Halanaerobiales bacterium]|nr:PDZ domain-containing protein [Halanaerobiales bacterium]
MKLQKRIFVLTVAIFLFGMSFLVFMTTGVLAQETVVESELETITKDAIKLLEIGFYEEGVSKLKEAIAKDPLSKHIRYTEIYVALATEVPLKYVGDILLFYYQELLKEKKCAIIGIFQSEDAESGGVIVESVIKGGSADKSGIIKGDIILAVNGQKVLNRVELDAVIKPLPIGYTVQVILSREVEGQQLRIEKDVQVVTELGLVNNSKLVWAVFRLVDYGMFAYRAGHIDLTKQAAENIRNLEKSFPSAILWEVVGKCAVLLDALVMADQESPDKAYKYILDNEGLFAEFYVTGHPDYWVPLYTDRSKLAYFVQKDVSELPYPSGEKFEPQPYPDFNGNIIDPLEATH